MASSVDLTTCDREPIHIPGSIQSHGVLIACSGGDMRVLRCSDNAEQALGLASDPIGQRLADLVGEALVHDLNNALAKSSTPRRPSLMRSIPLGSRLWDIAVHAQAGTVIVEFEAASADAPDSTLEIARALIARTQSLVEPKTFSQSVPRLLQALLGYDRVMLYEFAADDSGKVIGEAKVPHLESFLGQHFPAADIPKQARELYIKNTIRVISDASGPSSAIRPERDASGEPLDLSYAHLRSVSPIHLEYLRNMGVGASMSISIIVNGRLWGLLACHHYAPKVLTMAQRTAAELYGDFLSLHLTAMHHRRRAEASIRARVLLDKMLAEMSFQHDVEQFLRQSLPTISTLVACDGVGLWLNGVWTPYGSTPPAAVMPRLAKVMSGLAQNAVMATHALFDLMPNAMAFVAEAAGALVVPLSQLPRDYLFFFRKEKIQTLEWGGDPNKTYASGPMGDRLSPRKSFAVWKEIVKGQSDPWSEDDRTTAEALLTGLREVILRHTEVLAAERKRAEVRQRILNDELNHRVKNILALIKSLVNQKPDDRETLEGFMGSLRGRILALSNAHDQVVRSEGGGSLRQLLMAELSPYDANQIVLDGPDIGLDSRAYSVMALVLHELATNAAKYGALSVVGGKLEVGFAAEEDGSCTIRWVESGGPRVRSPTRKGFGSVLLDRSVPFDLNGTSEVVYGESGVSATINIPARFLMDHLPAREPGAVERQPSADAIDFPRSSALLVEDQLVIALDVEEMLRGIGVETSVTVATAQDALKAIAHSAPDFAILDVNLGHGTSLSVAEELIRLKVPFIFATGYGDSTMIPAAMGAVPILRKPYTEDCLREALRRVVGADAKADVDPAP